MKRILSICALLFASAYLFAQAPEKLSYQAVIRNNSNILLSNQQISMRVSILQGSAGGTAVYIESQNPNTNANGLTSIEIGGGTPILGNFTSINWENGPYFIKTETDPTGGTNYSITGTSQLLSVPYALYAKTSGSSLQGPIGPQGPVGLTGPQGPAGNDGATGPQGPIGLTGPQGPQGPIGLTGPQGPAGPAGNDGATGPQGPIGLTGPQGPAGPSGSDGATGPQGPIGLTGPQGPQGPIGLTGPQGPAGPAGNDGATGPQGPIGLTGPQGPAGNGLTNGTANSQILYWNGTAWVTLNPGSNGQILTICDGVPTWTNTGICLGNINSLNCNSANNTGTLEEDTPASSVSSSIPYTGGNGGAYQSLSFASTGVTGLTATINAGNFANGSGNLIFNISGTPNGSGTANFNINIGGQNCSLSLNVAQYSGPGSYPAGTVHCTGTPTEVVDVTNPTTGRTWMDRNLGASQKATTSTTAAAYGDLYQWGRNADGHQCRISSTTTTLSSTDQAPTPDFILINTGNRDWRSPQNTNLWQGVNGINNPCPNGYRLPTQAEMESERLSWNQNNANGAIAAPLKWALPGGRSNVNGILEFVGVGGGYWTSTVSGSTSGALYFSPGAATGFFYRAYGYSVRCFKNQ